MKKESISGLSRRMIFTSVVGLAISLFTFSVHAREIAEIKASGRLIVAVPDQRNPPFFFEENGEMKGLDIDLSKAVAAALGVQAEFNRTGKSFNDAVKLVTDDKADISVAKISRTLGRAQNVLFTDAYISLPHALMVNRLRFAQISGGRPVTLVLQNYTDSIGVIANSSFVGFAKANFPKAKIVEFSSWPEVVDAVTKGKVTAAYRDAFEVKRIFKINPDISFNVRSVIIDDIKDTIGIAVNQKNHLLVNFLNLYLAQNNLKFTSEQILKKYENYLN